MYGSFFPALPPPPPLATLVTSCYVIPLPLFQLSSCPDLFVLLLVRYLSQGFSRSPSVHLLFLLLACFFLFSISLSRFLPRIFLIHPLLSYLFFVPWCTLFFASFARTYLCWWFLLRCFLILVGLFLSCFFVSGVIKFIQWFHCDSVEWKRLE